MPLRQSRLPMEHTATSAPKNRVSRFAVVIADFCNKIGTSATSQRDPVRSGYGGKPEEKCVRRETGKE